MPTQPRVSAFTQTYEGLSNVLRTECEVYRAFDPNSDDVPEHLKIMCLWDTGATNSVVSTRLVQALKLQPSGMVKVSHAQGSTLVNTYMVNVMLPNNVGFPFLQVNEGVLAGFDMLIGMDIISRGDFSISCPKGKTIFSFQLPSTHEVDYVEGKRLDTPFKKPGKVPGRNDPCPCGSGIKYKNCHGK